MKVIGAVLVLGLVTCGVVVLYVAVLEVAHWLAYHVRIVPAPGVRREEES